MEISGFTGQIYGSDFHQDGQERVFQNSLRSRSHACQFRYDSSKFTINMSLIDQEIYITTI